jgi:predicted RNA-binding protein YlxR (DUF448 family)
MGEQAARRASGRGRRGGSERSCVVCGRRAALEDLLRLVCTPDGEIAADLRRHLPGRGANICPDAACITGAVERKRLGKVLRREVRYPASGELLRQVRDATSRQLKTLVASSAGKGAYAAGVDLTAQAIRDGRADLVLVAADSTRRQSVERLARGARIPLGVVGHKARLGELYGRAPTGAVAVRGTGLARAIERMTRRLEGLGSKE